MVILGIETSCDETGLGIMHGRKLLANLVASQEHIHGAYGGIVPELAGRAHCSVIDVLLERALAESGCALKDISHIGVTAEPGLKGSLMVGVAFAAGLGCALNVPVYRINHLHAHLAANFLNPKLKFPALGLVVSGGHTSFFHLTDRLTMKLLGRTLDDACGETFDKVGRMLELPFPGGPQIEKHAKTGDEKKIKFPVTLLGGGSLDFSFSGLKTSVLYYIKKHGLKDTADICASFQRTVGDILAAKIERALKKHRVKSFIMGGGVAQNSYLAGRVRALFRNQHIPLLIPEKKLCLDNGAMVAVLTHFLVKTGHPPDPLRISVTPTK